MKSKIDKTESTVCALDSLIISYIQVYSVFFFFSFLFFE